MIEGTASVAAFFRESLVDALRSRRIEASELVESYLVQLMAELARPGGHPYVPGRQTLVDMMIQAHAARSAEQARLMRELGDTALLWSGVFRERLLHQGLDLSYYVTVGGGAYRRAGVLHRVLRATPLDELCLELGCKFKGLSDALDEAACLGLQTDDLGLVRLLRRFRRTGSDWMRRALERAGLDPEDIGNPRN